MSLERDITYLMEDEIFKPASDDEIKRRTAERDAKRSEARKAKAKELGRDIDICPHCAADLREDDGINADETSYGSYNLYYEKEYDSWEYGDSTTHDSDTTAYHCGSCDGDLERGIDFDA